MVKILLPTKATLLIFIVLVLGTILIPFIINFVPNFYITYTSTPEQLTQLAHQRQNPIIYFFVYPSLYLLWLYFLGCIIIYLTAKKKK